VAEENKPVNGIKLTTPFGPIAATGTAAILGLMIVILLGYLYFEMDKIGDRFALQTQHMDERFKMIEDVQRYNACLSRLGLWRAGRPRDEVIDFDSLPSEFLYCLPNFVIERRKG
jgi:hypothetical protein